MRRASTPAKAANRKKRNRRYYKSTRKGVRVNLWKESPAKPCPFKPALQEALETMNRRPDEDDSIDDSWNFPEAVPQEDEGDEGGEVGVVADTAGGEGGDQEAAARARLTPRRGEHSQEDTSRILGALQKNTSLEVRISHSTPLKDAWRDEDGDEGGVYESGGSITQNHDLDASGAGELDASRATQVPVGEDAFIEETPSQLEASQQDVSQEVGSFFAGLQAHHKISKAAAALVYDFLVVQKSVAISHARLNGELPDSFKSLMHKVDMELPKICLHVTFLDESKAEDEVYSESIPRELTDNPKRLVRVCAFIPLGCLLRFIEKLHRKFDSEITLRIKTIDLSSDGVQGSKHGKRSLHIVSICVPGCRLPYPWRVFEFRAGGGPSLEQLMRPVVGDILGNDLQLRRISVDGKEEQAIKGHISNTGFYSCCRCKSKGTSELSGRVHFPCKLHNATPRTREEYINIFERFPEGNPDTSDPLLRDIFKGMLKRSPLLDLPDFDFVDGFTIDSLHQLHGGLSKRMHELTLLKDLAIRNPKRRKEVGRRLEALYEDLKVPSEMHRTSTLNPGFMKGAHWQALDTFVFPSWIEGLEGPEMLRRVVLAYSFLIRACYSDDDTLRLVEESVKLDKVLQRFLVEWEQAFNSLVTTYNLHKMNHLLESRRKHGPLWEYSTARQESMYAKLKYESKCNNVPKQILHNFYAAEWHRHYCRNTPSLRFSDKATAKTDDSLVFYDDKFYQITSIDDPTLSLLEVKTKTFNSSKVLRLPWKLVGVYKEDTSSHGQEIKVHKNEIRVKAVRCGGLIMTADPRWFIT